MAGRIVTLPVFPLLPSIRSSSAFENYFEIIIKAQKIEWVDLLLYICVQKELIFF